MFCVNFISFSHKYFTFQALALDNAQHFRTFQFLGQWDIQITRRENLGCSKRLNLVFIVDGCRIIVNDLALVKLAKAIQVFYLWGVSTHGGCQLFLSQKRYSPKISDIILKIRLIQASLILYKQENFTGRGSKWSHLALIFSFKGWLILSLLYFVLKDFFRPFIIARQLITSGLLLCWQLQRISKRCEDVKSWGKK